MQALQGRMKLRPAKVSVSGFLQAGIRALNVSSDKHGRGLVEVVLPSRNQHPDLTN